MGFSSKIYKDKIFILQVQNLYRKVLHNGLLLYFQPSFLELPTLSHVSKAFHIELWFLCQRLNGLLLYNGQNSNGHGDFLSINLVGGRVQLRYDLGSGPANLTTKEVSLIWVE